MATEIIIDSEQQKQYCRTRLEEIEIDGKSTVVFKKTDESNTARQRRLRWTWMGEISQSGLGQNDTKDGVDLYCKWRFARPILLRDSERFGEILAGFEHIVNDYDQDTKKICYRAFTRDYISVQKLMNKKQEAEYLRDIERFWIRQGATLTDPKNRNVDLSRYEEEGKK